MKRYYITYADVNDDYTHIWVMAASKADAIDQAKREFWDIKRIVDCHY